MRAGLKKFTGCFERATCRGERHYEEVQGTLIEAVEDYKLSKLKESTEGPLRKRQSD